MARWCVSLTVLAVAFALWCRPALPGPSGKPLSYLAFLKNGKAWVAEVSLDAKDNHPLAPQALPKSEGATLVSLCPTDGMALYFVPRSAKRESREGCRGYVSLPPYREVKTLLPPLDNAWVGTIVWTRDGQRAYLSGERCTGVFTPVDGRFSPLPFAVESTSHDGSVVAWRTEKEVRVHWPSTGKGQVLFSVGHPQPLFDALRHALFPKNLKELTGTLDLSLWRDSRNWGIGPPALSPEGRRLYFAVNAGSGLGAAGNTTYCFLTADLKRGSLAPWSKLGVMFARLPHVCEVSPDGRRLLLLTSFHVSAAENPCQADIVDLYTQKSREMLWADGRLKKNPNLTSLTDGACWSPNGRYVAVSVLYYDAQAAFKELGKGDWQPRDEDFTLTVFNAITGAVLLRFPGGHAPSWSLGAQ